MVKLKNGTQLSTLVNMIEGNTKIIIYDKNSNVVSVGYVASIHNEDNIDLNSCISELRIDDLVRVTLA